MPLHRENKLEYTCSKWMAHREEMWNSRSEIEKERKIK